MKERPILFSTSMVKALLEGRKTQTRRVIKNPPFLPCDVPGWRYDGVWSVEDDGDGLHYLESLDANGEPTENYRPIYEKCPYGVPGDILWVREQTEMYFMPNILTGEPTNAQCGKYTADESPVLDESGFDYVWWYSKNTCPSIHMPRWAARIFLRVEDVRAERLQDITGEDAIAEGIEPAKFHKGMWRTINPDSEVKKSFRKQVKNAGAVYDVTPSPVAAFSSLWDSINAKRGFGWDTNPWVWVMKFSVKEVLK